MTDAERRIAALEARVAKLEAEMRPSVTAINFDSIGDAIATCKLPPDFMAWQTEAIAGRGTYSPPDYGFPPVEGAS